VCNSRLNQSSIIQNGERGSWPCWRFSYNRTHGALGSVWQFRAAISGLASPQTSFDCYGKQGPEGEDLTPPFLVPENSLGPPCSGDDQKQYTRRTYCSGNTRGCTAQPLNGASRLFIYWGKLITFRLRQHRHAAGAPRKAPCHLSSCATVVRCTAGREVVDCLGDSDFLGHCIVGYKKPVHHDEP